MSTEKCLQALLAKYDLVKSDAMQSHDLNFVLHGNVVKSNLSQGNFSDTDITLLWNADTAPVFSLSKRSTWPLQACVNDLPTCKDNMLVISIWFGKQKPKSYVAHVT